jgi:hypothetical protein
MTCRVGARSRQAEERPMYIGLGTLIIIIILLIIIL